MSEEIETKRKVGRPKGKKDYAMRVFKKDPLQFKAGKLWLAMQQNPNTPQKELMRELGFKHDQNLINVKKTQVFQYLERKYGDILKEKITPDKVATEHIKNIVQDLDKGAKNTAIRMYKEFTEPDLLGGMDGGEVKVIFTKKIGEQKNESL